MVRFKRNDFLNFLIPKSLHPNVVNSWYFKHRLFDLTDYIVWNIKGLRHLNLKIENQSLLQRLNSFKDLTETTFTPINVNTTKWDSLRQFPGQAPWLEQKLLHHSRSAWCRNCLNLFHPNILTRPNI